MADALTLKQEEFCRKYIESGNASEAYRRAYNAKNMKNETIHRAAFELLENPKVATILEELKAEMRCRHDVTVESLCQELEADRQLARQNGQAGAAMTATMDIAKLHGLLIEKRQLQNIDSDNADNMTDAQLEAIARQGLETH